MVVTAPGGPTITVVIRQGPMFSTALSVTRLCAVVIGYAQTLSGLAAVTDQKDQRAQRDARQVSRLVPHIPGSMRQREMLDQLADRGVNREDADHPGGAQTRQQRRQNRRREDEGMDHLVEPGDLRPAHSLRGIDNDQLEGQRCAKGYEPPAVWLEDGAPGSRSGRVPGDSRHTAGVIAEIAAVRTAAATTLVTSGLKTLGMM